MALVKVVGDGEGTITAWYLSRLAIATVTAPYEQPVKPVAFAAFRRAISSTSACSKSCAN